MKTQRYTCALLFLVLLTAASFARAQGTEEQQVEQVIQRLFAGMKTGDSAMVHRAFHENARLVTSFKDNAGQPAMEEITLYDFLQAIGQPHAEAWNEVPESIHVTIDDNMAVAWVPYAFYVDTTFSHCGVDAVQLVKDTSGWKIVSLTDTRRRTGCKEKK